jgi:putative hydroxymethylpyrimidine transport system substrate-binding protein
MRGIRRVLAGMLVALLIAGCGGSGSDGSTETVAAPVEPPPLPPEIRVSLDGYKGPENVGLLMAEKRGYFDDAGLNVWLGAPLVPRNTISYVATRMDELGVAQLPQVAVARENGLPIVALGSVIPRPTAALIWLGNSKIRTVADLQGKTIGTEGIPFQEDLLRIALEDAGLKLEDVEVKFVSNKLVPALLNGGVDAIFGGSANIEGVELESRGAKPVVKPVQSFGVSPYDELVVITREDRAAADPQAMRAFMAAVRRGTAAAIKDPEAAAKLIAKSPETNPTTTRGEIEAQLKKTLPLLSETGRLDPDQTAGFLDWMQEEGWTQQAIPVSEVLADQ